MDPVLRRKQSFLLRLPPTLREQTVSMAQREGISMNQFIGLAVAEKLTRMQQQVMTPTEYGRMPLQAARNIL